MLLTAVSTDALVFALLYQVPAWVLGQLLKWLLPHPWVRAVLLLPGTFVHEFLHLAMGLILNGKPRSISLWPRKIGEGQWVLGSVGFVNLRWYNAVFIGLAPLLAIAGLMMLAPAPKGWSLQVSDFQRWAITAPILVMCMPSPVDLKLCLKSWPILVLLMVWGGVDMVKVGY
jgi:hypothetical protein